MAKNYSTKNCFRQIPNALLARFFSKFNLFTELDFKGMKETKPDVLFEAWLLLPEKRRKEIDSILQEVFELSCEKGSLAIIDEAKFQMSDEPEQLESFIEALSNLPNDYHRAMTTFLDHPEFWKGATRFYHADTLNGRYWRKRPNMGHKQAACDNESTSHLARMIRDHFHLSEGRGNNCIVEVYRRDGRDYFFAFPEDFSQLSVEWVDGEFDQRPHNPAFEIVFVYSQEEGTLDINFQGPKKTVVELQIIFAKAILKIEKLPEDTKDKMVYDLNPIRFRDFCFANDIGSGIQDVYVKKMRFTSQIDKSDRITFEVDPYQNRYAIYDKIDQASKSIQLQLYNVTQVELIAPTIVDHDQPLKNFPIRLTHPNFCSLKYDDVGLKLRGMLKASGVEPQISTLKSETEETVEA